MINRILERLEEEKQRLRKMRNTCIALSDKEVCDIEEKAYNFCKSIVQEVAKEHRKLNRCDTCTHYIADVVPPICYFCCKGMEDNYQQKGE